MSHTVKLKVALTNQEAIRRACIRMELPAPEQGASRLFGGNNAVGTAIKLPGWKYPAVVQENGDVKFDNFNGHWGNMKELDRFAQYYVVEAARMQAENAGYSADEQLLANGDIELTVNDMSAYEFA